MTWERFGAHRAPWTAASLIPALPGEGGTQMEAAVAAGLGVLWGLSLGSEQRAVRRARSSLGLGTAWTNWDRVQGAWDKLGCVSEGSGTNWDSV